MNRECFGCLVGFLRFRFEALVAFMFVEVPSLLWCFKKKPYVWSCGVVVSYAFVADLYGIAGLVVVAPICTCRFVKCRVCEYVHFVRCIGALATDHDKLHLHSS